MTENKNECEISQGTCKFNKIQVSATVRIYHECEVLIDKSVPRATVSSRKHLRTKVTPDFHLTYSKNGGNLGSESK